MASKYERRRLLLGAPVTPQALALLLTSLVLALVVGYAVLSWLEGIG